MHRQNTVTSSSLKRHCYGKAQKIILRAYATTLFRQKMVSIPKHTFSFSLLWANDTDCFGQMIQTIQAIATIPLGKWYKSLRANALWANVHSPGGCTVQFDAIRSDRNSLCDDVVLDSDTANKIFRDETNCWSIIRKTISFGFL